MMDFYLALAGCVLFSAYLAYILFRFGIPKSLSMTYYLLGKKRLLFIAMMFCVPFLLFIPMIDFAGPNVQFLAFLSPASILFVGAAPCFMEEEQGKVHVGAAVLAAVCGLAWTVAVGCWDLIVLSILICIFLAVITKSLKRGLMWWMEMVAFLSVFWSLLYLTS